VGDAASQTGSRCKWRGLAGHDLRPERAEGFLDGQSVGFDHRLGLCHSVLSLRFITEVGSGHGGGLGICKRFKTGESGPGDSIHDADMFVRCEIGMNSFGYLSVNPLKLIRWSKSRFGPRKPQSYAYAPFAPIFHYNTAVADFYGGNFWDMRATGIRLANPAAEQAQGPPVNPVEMANPDSACVVWKASLGGYAPLVLLVGGAQSFAINWPSNVATVCATPGPPPASDPFPVHLSAQDRGTSNATYDHYVPFAASGM
jgi:hypothetical protein